MYGEHSHVPDEGLDASRRAERHDAQGDGYADPLLVFSHFPFYWANDHAQSQPQISQQQEDNQGQVQVPSELELEHEQGHELEHEQGHEHELEHGHDHDHDHELEHAHQQEGDSESANSSSHTDSAEEDISEYFQPPGGVSFVTIEQEESMSVIETEDANPLLLQNDGKRVTPKIGVTLKNRKSSAQASFFYIKQEQTKMTTKTRFCQVELAAEPSVRGKQSPTEG